MRRNTIFMWAYITFIFIGIFARLIFDYPLWAPLVLAITLSSIFFSIEDLYNSLERAINDSCDIAENFLSEMEEHTKNKQSFFEKISANINQSNNAGYDLSDIQLFLDRNYGSMKETVQTLANLEVKIENKRNSQRRYRIIANIFTYLGFLILFCTLIFSSLVTIPNIIQEVFTVLSFAIILVTQQVNLIKLKSIREESTDMEDIIEGHEKLESALQEIEKRFDCSNENLTSECEEVPNHAD